MTTPTDGGKCVAVHPEPAEPDPMPSSGPTRWTFTVNSSIALTATAEVMLSPEWVQLHVFQAFPTSFQLDSFDPSRQVLVVEWPAGSANRWLCHDAGILDGSVTPVDPQGNSWHSIAVDNGRSGCDVGLARD